MKDIHTLKSEVDFHMKVEMYSVILFIELTIAEDFFRIRHNEL